jgi:metal-sulfur cluster biosynthetic enzyme
MATKEEVIEVLKTIEDPELFLDIWFLGLVYKVELNETLAKLEITFTSPMCPAGPMIIDQIKDKVSALEGIDRVEVEVVFDPPWQPSDEVKGLLGMM